MGEERVRPWRGNQHYWEYEGEPVLLLGGSDEDNLFNHPELALRNLEALTRCRGNYVRCTLSCRDPGNIWPFAEVGGRYDLSRFNPEFWGRLRRFLRKAYEQGVIVQVEIWDPHDFWDWGSDGPWSQSPWSPSMNVNYKAGGTILSEGWPHHPSHRPNPFFLAPERGDAVLLEYQERFVAKVLEETLEFPNVLYCIDNETQASPEWSLHWARFMRERAKEAGVELQLAEMWDPWDLRHELHRVTYEHPELFTFVEVSQNNWSSGRVHYDRLIWLRGALERSGRPRPMNNVKIYGAPRPREPAIPALNVDRFWRCIFAGCANARFHRPPTGIGLSPLSQAVIRAARTFASSFDIFSSEPRPDLVESPREAYCLAKPGEAYALYLPSGGRVRLKADCRGSVECLCLNPEGSSFTAREVRRVEEEVQLRAPSEATWLALVLPRA